jgi:hypothetical protein
MSEPQKMVEQSVLDEAIRMGNAGVTQANRYMTVSKIFADAIEQALVFIDSGRTTQARDRLRRALIAASSIVK